MADSNGSKLDTKTRFVQIYDRLKSELLEDPAFDFTDDSRQWIERVSESGPNLSLSFSQDPHLGIF